MKSIAISGSFDPITNGHLWLIEEAVTMAEHVYVIIASNPNKKGMFTLEERREMVESVLVDSRHTEVRVLPANTMLVDYLYHELDCQVLLRGLRNATDFEYESTIDRVQSLRQPMVRTLYVNTPRDLTEVSSSIVKSLVGLHGWEDMVGQYVPLGVLEALMKKVNTQ